MPAATVPAAVLLVAHGSRLPEARAGALELAAAVGTEGERVEVCFIELTQPTADEALASLSEDGVRELVVQPLLLLPGNHARFDVGMIADLAVERGFEVRVGQPLGSDVRLLAAAEDNVRPHLPADAMLVIASGTASDAALRSLDTSSALVASALGGLPVAGAPATLDGRDAVDAWERLRDDGHERIVVLPWMLFPGRLEAETTSALQAAAERTGGTPVVADRFGAAPGVVDAVRRRIERARRP